MFSNSKSDRDRNPEKNKRDRFFASKPSLAVTQKQELPVQRQTTSRTGRTFNATEVLVGDGSTGIIQSIQTKLAIGEVGDKYEREADRVAKETVQHLRQQPLQREQGAPPVQQRPISPYKLQRREEFQRTSAPPIQASRDIVQCKKTSRDVTQYDDNFLTKLVTVAGHGTYAPRVLQDPRVNEPNMITVPSNTTFTMWLPHGATLSDWFGGQIDLANNFANLVKYYKELDRQLYVYEPGDEVHNYLLVPGKNLSIQLGSSKLFVADRPYTLQELLNKFSGRNIHWSACAEVLEDTTFESIYGNTGKSKQMSSEITENDPKHLGEDETFMNPRRKQYLIDVMFGNDFDKAKQYDFLRQELDVSLINSEDVTSLNSQQLLDKREGNRFGFSYQKKTYEESHFRLLDDTFAARSRREKVRSAILILYTRIEKWKQLLEKVYMEDQNLWSTIDINNIRPSEDLGELYQKIANSYGGWNETKQVEEVEKSWDDLYREYKKITTDTVFKNGSNEMVFEENEKKSYAREDRLKPFSKELDVLKIREHNWHKVLVEILQYHSSLTEQIRTDNVLQYGKDRTEATKIIEQYISQQKNQDTSSNLQNRLNLLDSLLESAKEEDKRWQNIEDKRQEIALKKSDLKSHQQVFDLTQPFTQSNSDNENIWEGYDREEESESEIDYDNEDLEW